jgi:hypothetical protein
VQVKKELKSLEEMDIIEKVKGFPTPWVLNLVATLKPNAPHKVRVCVDNYEESQHRNQNRKMVAQQWLISWRLETAQQYFRV